MRGSRRRTFETLRRAASNHLARSLAWDLLLPRGMRKTLTVLIAHLASFAAVSATGCDESEDSSLAFDPSDGAHGVSNESQPRPEALATSVAASSFYYRPNRTRVISASCSMARVRR